MQPSAGLHGIVARADLHEIPDLAEKHKAGPDDIVVVTANAGLRSDMLIVLH